MSHTIHSMKYDYIFRIQKVYGLEHFGRKNRSGNTHTWGGVQSATFRIRYRRTEGG